MSKENAAYKLGYDCPVKVSNMPACKGGFACSQCEKTVFDYSKMSYSDFIEARKENEAESTCGIYNGHQLEGVYGDWRDRVTKAYRNSLLRAQKRRVLVVFVPLFAAALFLSGCGSAHYCGMSYMGPADTQTQNVNKVKTIEKSTVDPEEEKRLQEQKRIKEEKRKQQEKEANKGLNDIADVAQSLTKK